MASSSFELEAGAVPSRWIDRFRALSFLVVAGCAYSVLAYVLFLLATILEPHIGLLHWIQSNHSLLVPLALALILALQCILIAYCFDLRTRVKRLEK